jgi:heme exporter protein C
MTRRLVTVGGGLVLIGFSLLTLTAYLGLMWAPDVDAEAWNAPNSYRILFLHVPFAWASFMAFGLLFVGSLGWFLKRSDKLWKLVPIGGETGLLYCLGVLISGPLWGAAEWGVPWDWSDVRLNTFAILGGLALFIVLGHRASDDGEESRDTLAAVGLFGFGLVPITYMATRWWQERHPGPVIGGGEGSGLAPEILQVMLMGALATMILLAGQVCISWAVQDGEARLRRLQRELEGHE